MFMGLEVRNVWPREVWKMREEEEVGRKEEEKQEAEDQITTYVVVWC